jgi:outer membrane protein assembly factor BamB
VWPGGLGVHDDGSLHVVFGNHAHRLDRELRVLASAPLPRARPYNSFVTLPDGHLVTKDFGGSLPAHPVGAEDRDPCELVVLDPLDLAIVARLVLPEASIARLSADGSDVYVVGDTSLLRVRWDGTALALDDAFTAPYRTLEGQTYGWDCVLAAGAAWFLDDGDGSEGFTGTLRGHGLSTAPLHLVRVDLATSEVSMVEVCGLPGGLVANPPVVDEGRGIVLAYDSGNGVVSGIDLRTLEPRWRREQDHASHLLLYEGTGEVVTGDGTDVVVLDIATGEELARADSGGGVQSVLFPTPGAERDLYVCSLLAVSRVTVA